MNRENNPLAEVFGYMPGDRSAEAVRYRKNRLCPFNNKVPSCTKDKASDKVESPKAVNVASVPQRSPFRYPGGKTWFVPKLREWLKSKPNKPKLLIEPFAGGGIVSLTAIFENLVDEALLVELDQDIAAVWQTLVNGDAEWLAKRILTFDMNKENAIAAIKANRRSTKEKAFQTDSDEKHAPCGDGGTGYRQGPRLDVRGGQGFGERR